MVRWQILIVLAISLAGCRGCTFTSSNQADKNAKEREKQRLTVHELKMLPAAPEAPLTFVKAGHWTQARQEVKANQADESLVVNIQAVDRSMNPVTLPGGDFLRFNRDLSLPKGQQKLSELLAFIPETRVFVDETTGVRNTRATLHVQYAQRGLGSPIVEQPCPLVSLTPVQYLLVILSKEPARYTAWHGLNCIVWPSEAKFETDKIAPHRIAELKEDQIRMWLPDQLCAWTAISHIVWTDIAADSLSEMQKQAMLDWLHFGGQIILSGPDCLAGVSNSFLAPYLPALNFKNENVSEADIEALNTSWLVKASDDVQTPLVLSPQRKIPRISGTLMSDSNWIENTGDLIAERRVGNGRIVMTMFPISEDLFIRWPSYGSLVNGALLRKPPREWIKSLTSEFDTLYAGENRFLEANPRFSTMFRLLSRDLALIAGGRLTRSGLADPITSNSNSVPGSGINRTTGPVATMVVPIVADDALARDRLQTAIGSWNDTSGISIAAEASLRAASGISVPRIGVIIKLLAGYLFVLVPLNWIVFRAIGRVELAWMAAPIIAIAGAAVVARSVQLDIGFSRSENRVNCLELHRGYPRGHLTTYTALYTSLSTDYRALFPDGSGVVLPFSSSNSSTSRGRSRQAVKNNKVVDYRYASSDGSGLASFPILSNTMEMVHAEEVVDLEGSIEGGWVSATTNSMRISNRTKLPVHDAAVFSKSSEGKIMAGWLGPVDSGRDVVIEMLEHGLSGSNLWMDQWDSNSTTKMQDFTLLANGATRMTAETDAALSIGIVFERLLKGYSIQPGEILLLGWTDKSLGKLEVRPKATQRAERTAVIAHLAAPLLPSARADHSMPGVKMDIIEE